MVSNLQKRIELAGKKILGWVVRKIFFLGQKSVLLPSEIHKILILRLDQRIGNGLMLMPLLRAIKKNRADISLHVLINVPVAELFENYFTAIVNRVWPYDQHKLLHHPFRFIRWLLLLRQERFDLIISSHNPDNFSLSQAILGRWCGPKMLIGFQWKNSSDFYDAAIFSSTDKHYCESQLDLWRYFYPKSKVRLGGLKIQTPSPSRVLSEVDVFPASRVLIWLGATGDKVLAPRLVDFLVEQIELIFRSAPVLAAGPDDEGLLACYSLQIQEKTLLWKKPLVSTAIFFSNFSVFISGDTGPMHLAAALGLSTLTIFTNSNLTQYGYQDGSKHFSRKYAEEKADLVSIHTDLMVLKKLMIMSLAPKSSKNKGT